MRTLFLCVLLAVWPVFADRCDIPADKAGFVQRLPADPIDRGVALAEALKSAPDDFTLNRLLLHRTMLRMSTLREKYRAALAANPDSIEAKYLYARSLVGSNTPEALRLFGELLAKDPEYPWIHLSQLLIYRTDVFRDRKKLESSFVVLRRVCPSLTETWEYLGELENLTLIKSEAARLREYLNTSQDTSSFKLYRMLWAAEFRVSPNEEHEKLRRLVAQDIERLQHFKSQPEIRAVILSGARLSKNETLAKDMEAQRQPGVMELFREWQKANPRPKPEDPIEKREAYARTQLQQSAKWTQLAPNDVIGYSERLNALVTLKAAAEVLGRAGEDLLEAERRRGLGVRSFFLSVARAYLERGILLERVPAILEEALASFDDPEGVVEFDFMRPEAQFTSRNRMMNVVFHTDAAVLLSELHEKQGDFDKAREVLRSLEQYLVQKAPSTDKDEEAMSYRLAQFSFWQRTGTLAEHEGRKLDALHAYREASNRVGLKRDAMIAAQRKLWKELGGSDEGWTRWLNAKATPTTSAAQAPYGQFTPVSRRLPEFSVKDLQGRTSTLAHWKGKTVVAAVWATWCAPCLAELPHVEKLAAGLKDRSDVLVVSLNTDENTGVVEPFMKKNGWTFPVLLAKQLAEDLMPYFVIPRTWIIRDGIVVSESIGFGLDSDTWTNTILTQLK